MIDTYKKEKNICSEKTVFYSSRKSELFLTIELDAII